MSNPQPVRFVIFYRPAVQSGLLVYEIRPWLTAMEHHRNEVP